MNCQQEVSSSGGAGIIRLHQCHPFMGGKVFKRFFIGDYDLVDGSEAEESTATKERLKTDSPQGSSTSSTFVSEVMDADLPSNGAISISNDHHVTCDTNQESSRSKFQPKVVDCKPSKKSEERRGASLPSKQFTTGAVSASLEQIQWPTEREGTKSSFRENTAMWLLNFLSQDSGKPRGLISSRSLLSVGASRRFSHRAASTTPDVGAGDTEQDGASSSSFYRSMIGRLADALSHDSWRSEFSLSRNSLLSFSSSSWDVSHRQKVAHSLNTDVPSPAQLRPSEMLLQHQAQNDDRGERTPPGNISCIRVPNSRTQSRTSNKSQKASQTSRPPSPPGNVSFLQIADTANTVHTGGPSWVQSHQYHTDAQISRRRPSPPGKVSHLQASETPHVAHTGVPSCAQSHRHRIDAQKICRHPPSPPGNVSYLQDAETPLPVDTGVPNWAEPLPSSMMSHKHQKAEQSQKAFLATLLAMARQLEQKGNPQKGFVDVESNDPSHDSVVSCALSEETNSTLGDTCAMQKIGTPVQIIFCPVDPTLKLLVTDTTYTKVYCQPYEFASYHNIMGLEDCVLFGIAMYNEEPDFLQCTLESIIRTSPRFDRNDKYDKQIATVIMLDGIEKVNEGTRQMLEDIGLWLPIPESTVDEFEPTVHLFRGTFHGSVQDVEATMAVILLAKVKNGGKLSSHDWLFNGLGNAIQPFQITILDVGTFPVNDALFNQYHSLARDEDVVVCCSNIVARLDQWWNPIQQMQYTEYLNIPVNFVFNSIMGILHPTSGPSAAFRWSALCGKQLLTRNKWLRACKREDHGTDLSSVSTSQTLELSSEESLLPRNISTQKPSISKEQVWRPENDISPLEIYSYSRDHELGVFWANVYMAEDTFLGGEMARTGVVRWYPDIVADFDAPTEYTALVKQRKRWFNGGLSVLFWQVRRSRQLFFRSSNGKTLLRRLAILVHLVWLMTYWTVYSVMLYGTFILVHCVLAERVIGASDSDETILPPSPWTLGLAKSWKWIHFAILAGYVLLAIFCRDPEKQKPLYYTVFTAHCLTQVGVTFLWLSAPTSTAEDLYDPDWLVWVVIGTLPFLALIYPLIMFPRKFWKALLCLPAFIICCIPFCVSVAIRPLANYHDTSWGAKGHDAERDTSRDWIARWLWRVVPMSIYLTITALIVGLNWDHPQPYLSFIIYLYSIFSGIGITLFLSMLLWCKWNRPNP